MTVRFSLTFPNIHTNGDQSARRQALAHLKAIVIEAPDLEAAQRYADQILIALEEAGS